VTAPPAGVPAVEFRAVTKRYGDVVAVDGVDLAVAAGEFVALLGPSGCGKTTCLRMIAGFELPTSGTVALAGADVGAVPPNRRDVNTVFQHYGLFAHLDVLANVAFGLRQRGVGRREREARALEALALVRLEGLERRRPHELSGGMQQRVALARALVMRPSVLLLDEPLGALDLQLRKQMQLELKRIHEDVGITFLFVTHDQEEAMAMADRIAVMRAGRVEQFASPAEVYDEPATAFVAGFVGDMNFLRGTLVQPGSPWVVESEHGTLVGLRSDGAAQAGRVVQVAVRPERVRLLASGERTENVLRGRVLTLMALADRVQVVVELADGATLLVRRGRGERHEPRPGDEVAVGWAPEAAALLDAR
jgi:spermidine/putrescine transport system ATP-binding protein